MSKDDIHNLFRYTIPGYFFISLIILFVKLFPNYAEGHDIIKGVLDKLLNEPASIVAGFVISYLLGFIFHSLHSFWYKWKYLQRWWKISEQRMKYVELIKRKKKIKDYLSIRALHDLILFKPKNTSLIERMTFISTKFYLHSSLIVSIIVFYVFEFIMFGPEFYSVMWFNLLVLFFGLLFWWARRSNFYLLDSIEKQVIETSFRKIKES